MNYPFQIRPGTWAHLDLPEDLTVADVRRLEAFLRALAGAMEADQEVERVIAEGRGVPVDYERTVRRG